jgi:hypothetical protein
VSAARKPKGKPRRKAGRVSPKRKARKLIFPLVIEGQEMRVVFTPDKFDGQGHFEFESPHKPRRRILVSETGYRSHFAPMDEIKAAGGPKGFARELVLAAVRAIERRMKGYDVRQLALF